MDGTANRAQERGFLAFTQVVLLAAAAATAQQVTLKAMGEAKCSALQKSDESAW